MNKALIALFVLMVACTPIQPTVNDNAMPPPISTDVQTTETVTSPTEDAMEETPPLPLETTGSEVDPYSTLGCEQMLTAQEFATACGKTADDFVVTSKLGTNNCFINVKDRDDPRLTAGFSLTGYADDIIAETEFDRRLETLKVGADKSVGERAYKKPFAPIDRETIYFLRNQFLVEIGSDTRICSPEAILAVAKTVDSKLS